MQQFRDYMYAQVFQTPIIPPKACSTPVQLVNPEAMFQASQSIISDELTTGFKVSTSANEMFVFVINGRKITCPHHRNGYVYDTELVEAYPNYFDSAISYLSMARFIVGYMKQTQKNNITVASQVFDMLHGKCVDDACDVLPVMLAALLLAEPKRNPSCFLPTLMGIELIRQQYPTPWGTPYQWDNTLQSPVLVHQEDNDHCYHTSYLYPMMCGIPSQHDLNSGSKHKFDSVQMRNINGDSRYNGRRKNQDEVRSHEMLMQFGGYFPNTHRFSNTEIKPKREEGIETVSDIKAFVLMSDWLDMRHGDNRSIEIIHGYFIKNTSRYPILDQRPDLLHKELFSYMWLEVVGAEPKKYIPGTYPKLLAEFGCKQKKVTAEIVANAIDLIRGSSRYRKLVAQETMLQFSLWQKKTKASVGVGEVEHILKTVYRA